MSEVNFGNLPPTIKNVSAVKPPFPDYVCIFDTFQCDSFLGILEGGI